jgi:hypothetical protein
MGLAHARQREHAADFELQRRHLAAFALVLDRDPKIRDPVNLPDGGLDDPLVQLFKIAVAVIGADHLPEILHADERRLSMLPACPQIIGAYLPERLRVLAAKPVLQRQVKAGIHGRVVQPLAYLRRIGVGTDAVLDLRLRQQRGDAPFGLPVLLEDVPLHPAAYQCPQRLFQVLLIMAVIFQNARQFPQGNLVYFLGR